MSCNIYGGYADKRVLSTQTGVVPSAAVTKQYITGIGTDGVITRAQPKLTDLSDYETGAATLVDNSTAGLTFTNLECDFVRENKKVTCYFRLTFPTTSDTSSNSIRGLPFVSANNVITGGGFVTFTNLAASPDIYITQSTTAFAFYKNTAAAYTNQELSGKTIRGVIVYQTA